MEFNPVGWFEIYVQDMDRATKFYESVLGIKLGGRKGRKGDKSN
jgi:predicted enzyme related to lactoylglutathione lyase